MAAAPSSNTSPPLAGGIEGGSELVSTDTYTVYLPLAAVNAGTPPPLFGVQMYGAVTHTTGLTKVATAGARWIRVPISWRSVEPADCTPEQYNWTSIDSRVQALLSEGIEPLLTLSGNPDWAAVYPMGPVTDVADLQEFAAALVERFDGDGYEDAPGSPVVRYWEMYNEPDNADEVHAAHGGYGYWGYRGDDYATMLDALYPVVKAASPHAQVVFGGVAHDNFDYEGGGFDPDFIDDVLSSCTGPCFDVMNFHYFPYYRSRWEGYGKDVMGKVNYLQAKLASYGFDRPLMCTETSWPRASTWGSEVLQSRYVVATYARGAAAGLVVHNWFAWKDIDSSLPGLLDSELQPKPAYDAYQTLTAQLGQARYVRSLTEGETGGGDLEGYVFSVPGADGWERLDVIWYDCPTYQHRPPVDCPSGTSQTMSVAASALRITDMYGNSGVQYDASDGVLDGRVTLQIGLDPVYVEHDSSLTLGGSGGGRLRATRLRATRLPGSLMGAPWATDVSQGGVYTYPNCRFGAGVEGDIDQYDVAALDLGWYVDWGSTQFPQAPDGLEYIQMIRLKQVGGDGWGMVSPGMSRFTSTVQANPGATWLVGNEPDSPFQDDMVPQAYAHAYHDVYYLIKGLDPTAHVAIGGIVQPTPLRLEYLDTVWETYRQTYSETMPVDVWNIHTFILRETIGPPDPEPCQPVTKTIPVWGAFIPPGSSAEEGELYCVRDQDDVEIFKQRIRAFRQWMADKGERDKPLIVTEYGVLFYEDFYDEDDRQLSAERVGVFMQDTFDFFLTETDSLIGYPYDENRLVQRWAWFSVNGDPTVWGGTLFDPDTRALRPLGEDFRAYTTALTPTVDVAATHVSVEPLLFWHADAPVTATLRVAVSNVGNISTTLPVTATFYDGPPGEPGTGLIGDVRVITAGLYGCADYEIVEMEWPGLAAGAHRFYVTVESADDHNSANDVVEGTVLVARYRSFLPLVLKR